MSDPDVLTLTVDLPAPVDLLARALCAFGDVDLVGTVELEDDVVVAIKVRRRVYAPVMVSRAEL